MRKVAVIVPTSKNAVKEMANEPMNSSTKTNPRTGMAHEAEAFGVISQTDEFKEGVKTFLETKKPKYA